MNPILKNIIAVVVGWLGGGAVNYGLVELGHKLMPIAGLDYSDKEGFMEAFAAILPSLDAKYFLFPFLAHALGTLVGALIAGLIAASSKMKIAMAVGAVFFVGGLAVNFLLPGKTWFTIVDLVFAYFPMAWIGGKVATR